MVFRDGPLSDFKVPLAWTGAAAVVIAGLVALGLLLTDQRQTLNRAGYGAARSEFDEVMEPVSGVLAAPVRWTGAAVDYVGGYFFAISENRRLKAENAELRRWKDAAIALKNVNDRYESLLKLRTEPPIPSVAARVVQDTRGPFSNARLADAGTESGVKIGYPVVSEHGVVGRIVGATSGASRILLLTDVDSRTPVMVERTNARAILTGDGGANPKLDYVRGIEPVKEGDLLLTSGDGGVYPRGLPVGMAARDLKGGWRARLFSDRAAIDYVRILQFTDLNAQVAAASLNSNGALPPLTGDEQRDLQAALTPPPAPLPLPSAAIAAGGAKPAVVVPPGAVKPAAVVPAGIKPAPAQALASVTLAGAKPVPGAALAKPKPTNAVTSSAKAPVAPPKPKPKPAAKPAAGVEAASQPARAAAERAAPRPPVRKPVEAAVETAAPPRAAEVSADSRLTASLNARAAGAAAKPKLASAKPTVAKPLVHHRAAAKPAGSSEAPPKPTPQPGSRPAPADIPF